jgi:hypothetical protein
MPESKENTLHLLEDLLKKAKSFGATSADVVLSDSASVSVNRRLGKPESVHRAEEADIGLRVFVGKKSAIVSSSDRAPEAVADMAERAVAMARLEWVAGALLALAVACGGGGGGGGDTGPDTGGDGGGGGDTGGDTGGDGGGDKGGGVVPDPPLVSGAFSFFGAAQGLSPDVRDVSADEGGNVYVAAWDALYVKARGASAFTRVDSAAAGLSTTCWPASEIANPSPPSAPGVCPIISVAGAAPGTAVVGYKGVGTDYDYDAPWALDSGGMDVVRLQGGAVTRARRVLVASPPQTVCEHWADAPRNSVCAENWSDSTWMAGRKKMRQIQRIVVNHDASRPLSYGDVYMGGTHGSLGILVANPAARGWVDKTAGHPAVADALQQAGGSSTSLVSHQLQATISCHLLQSPNQALTIY